MTLKTIAQYIKSIFTHTTDSVVAEFDKTVAKLRRVEEKSIKRAQELKAHIEALEGLRALHFDEADRAGDIAHRIENLIR